VLLWINLKNKYILQAKQQYSGWECTENRVIFNYLKKPEK